MPLSRLYGVTGPVVGRMFHVKHCLWCRWCSVLRLPGLRAGPLCMPVGGGPPAIRSYRELRLARRLEAWPGPATAHRHCGQAARVGLPFPPGTQAPNRGETIDLLDSASLHGYEVLNESLKPSIGVRVPNGDVNCVIPSHHRQNGDICCAKR